MAGVGFDVLERCIQRSAVSIVTFSELELSSLSLSSFLVWLGGVVAGIQLLTASVVR